MKKILSFLGGLLLIANVAQAGLSPTFWQMCSGSSASCSDTTKTFDGALGSGDIPGSYLQEEFSALTDWSTVITGGNGTVGLQTYNGECHVRIDSGNETTGDGYFYRIDQYLPTLSSTSTLNAYLKFTANELYTPGSNVGFSFYLSGGNTTLNIRFFDTGVFAYNDDSGIPEEIGTDINLVCPGSIGTGCSQEWYFNCGSWNDVSTTFSCDVYRKANGVDATFTSVASSVSITYTGVLDGYASIWATIDDDGSSDVTIDSFYVDDGTVPSTTTTTLAPTTTTTTLLATTTTTTSTTTSSTTTTTLTESACGSGSSDIHFSSFNNLTGWTDGDIGSGVSSQVTFDTKETLKLDTVGTTATWEARRTQDIGSITDGNAITVIIYPETLTNMSLNNSPACLQFDVSGTGNDRITLCWFADALAKWNGSGFTEIGTNENFSCSGTAEGCWQEWTISDFNTSANTFDVYLNDVLVSNDESYVSGTFSTNGLVILRDWNGGSTPNAAVYYYDCIGVSSSYTAP